LIAEGALGLLSAQTVHTIAGLVPVAAEVQSALEALSGRGMWGLGEEKIEGVDRLLVGVRALCALAPFAREVLKGAEAKETVARIARESGKTEDEIRGLLQASVQDFARQGQPPSSDRGRVRGEARGALLAARDRSYDPQSLDAIRELRRNLSEGSAMSQIVDLDVFWGTRREGVDECAARAVLFLQGLGTIDPSLGSWG
jgi:predicted transcriptional regulator